MSLKKCSKTVVYFKKNSKKDFTPKSALKIEFTQKVVKTGNSPQKATKKAAQKSKLNQRVTQKRTNKRIYIFFTR